MSFLEKLKTRSKMELPSKFKITLTNRNSGLLQFTRCGETPAESLCFYLHPDETATVNLNEGDFEHFLESVIRECAKSEAAKTLFQNLKIKVEEV